MKQTLKKISKIVVDAIVNSSSAFVETQKSLTELTSQVNQLAISVIEIAKTIKTHHDAIHDIYAMQDEIVDRLNKTSTIDTKVTIDKEKIPNKPNL